MMSCNNVPKAKLEFFNHNMELNTSIIASVVCELTFCQCKRATIQQVTVNQELMNRHYREGAVN